MIDFASNDYLGLSRHPHVLAAQRSASLAGSGGSRLLSGAHREHTQLENELAAWTGRERALLFSSGYLAALGAIATLAPFVDVAYSDALVHACAIDALRLTKLPRNIVPHATLPGRRDGDHAALFVTESVFGMDGSLAPLDALVAALHAGDVLIVDEAHALGVRGAHGGGLATAFADERIIVIGTLSKALGAAGGFVAGPADAIALLASAARTFVFDTAPAPAVVCAARAALAIVQSAEGDALRVRLEHNAKRLRTGLRGHGVAVADGNGPIVAIIIGSERGALAGARALESRGIFAPAIRPPTVPPGTSRLRLVVRANHTEQEIDALIDALAALHVQPA
ncbi:MAG: aminotransferase class I/II-fold pyridoxal phosphate-dependent enzyme [Candidatus Eremiobacteraeota bacterium]|nr:aminotransferase class I/II-fold pyridoxal phosphate-dependent enzyme [Candidatus Eremiobacteraeota bacterium]MBC5802714.1 aminotransferase class I/II-fold pyridoxal phosphate-dependent enzyme [Candidatus Eremiobacteraeota bacterium]MBC5821562.1 aminotransferase class I/II-fold pyridoxal phosphate-dependent enzyme [Candidatus Eremiobacteraeota bacterium]